MTTVRNMTSNRSGNEVANQFIIETGDETIFQSYRTTIAKYTPKGLVFDTGAMDYSVTTSKYLRQFTNMNKAEWVAGIKDGTITVEDLN